MNQTLLFIQASLHRAINEGHKSFDVSVLDIKELLAVVASSEAREQRERCGIVTGFIRHKSLCEMRSGKSLYCTIRRKKNDEYSQPIYSDPIDHKPVDVISESSQDSV